MPVRTTATIATRSRHPPALNLRFRLRWRFRAHAARPAADARRDHRFEPQRGFERQIRAARHRLLRAAERSLRLGGEPRGNVRGFGFEPRSRHDALHQSGAQRRRGVDRLRHSGSSGGRGRGARCAAASGCRPPTGCSRASPLAARTSRRRKRCGCRRTGSSRSRRRTRSHGSPRRSASCRRASRPRHRDPGAPAELRRTTARCRIRRCRRPPRRRDRRRRG